MPRGARGGIRPGHRGGAGQVHYGVHVRERWEAHRRCEGRRDGQAPQVDPRVARQRRHCAWYDRRRERVQEEDERQGDHTHGEQLLHQRGAPEPLGGCGQFRPAGHVQGPAQQHHHSGARPGGGGCDAGVQVPDASRLQHQEPG